MSTFRRFDVTVTDHDTNVVLIRHDGVNAPDELYALLYVGADRADDALRWAGPVTWSRLMLEVLYLAGRYARRFDLRGAAGKHNESLRHLVYDVRDTLRAVESEVRLADRRRRRL